MRASYMRTQCGSSQYCGRTATSHALCSSPSGTLFQPAICIGATDSAGCATPSPSVARKSESITVISEPGSTMMVAAASPIAAASLMKREFGAGDAPSADDNTPTYLLAGDAAFGLLGVVEANLARAASLAA